MRKAQTALDRAQKREIAQTICELKAEFERLAKIHKSLDKVIWERGQKVVANQKPKRAPQQALQ
jgi:hypothetical protein